MLISSCGVNQAEPRTPMHRLRGQVFAIQQELRLPVHYVGVGEGTYDLLFFDPEQYVNGLFEETE